MQINWKLRLQNKVTLTALIVLAISIVYTILGMCGVVPSVSQEQITNVCMLVVEFLCVLGVVVDPSTKGLSDPNNVMQYQEPRDDRTVDEVIKDLEKGE